MLTKGEITKWMNIIQLRPNLCLNKKRQYEDLLYKYIRLFGFSHKDLKEVTLKYHKIELLANAKSVWEMKSKIHFHVNEEFDKLLKTRFIKHVKTIRWVFSMVLVFF